MKFGKEFRIHLEETLPEWRDKFLCYKPLKKLLKQLPIRIVNDPAVVSGDDANPEGNATARSLVDLHQWFVRILNVELRKLNEFYMDKEEEFIIRLSELKVRIERLKDKSSKSGVFSSESEFSEEMMDIRKDFVTIHGEMVLLKNYSSLNFAGLIKILKKYDKRTGGLLRLPFTRLAVHQPFLVIEPLTDLVHDCEANLELLFPLEAEVVESTPSKKDPSNQSLNNTGNKSTDTTPTLGEETMDVYRSTLAAMKAIRGLQKESSTYNPLSFSSFFKNHDADSTGAVTAENSASNSSSTLQDKEDADKEDANSV